MISYKNLNKYAIILKNKYLSSCVKQFSRNYNSIDGDKDYNKYDKIYHESIQNPVEFWSKLAQNIEWFKPYNQVLDNSNPPFTKWFVGGELNTSYNAIDRHVLNGMGDKTAIIYDSPITNQKQTLTYSELLMAVSKLAGALVKLGVQKGDYVIIYMPMVSETIISMLAVGRIGAIHSVVFGGFSSKELAKRIDHCGAKVVIAASCGIEPSRVVKYKPILDEALNISSHQPKHCIIYQRRNIEVATMKTGRDVEWENIIESAQPHDPVPVDANHPAYVLYTSGTTGAPKGIVRPTGGHAVILPWTMKAIYDMDKSDIWWTMSDFGWVVGHSYICYAPLLNGNTTIVYEGKPVGTPDEKQFFRVISEYKVRSLFTSPTALRAISRVDPEGVIGESFNLSNLNSIFIAGEPLDHATRKWTENAFKVPGLDHWWQTETGYAITATSVGLNMSKEPPRGSVGKPFVGYNLDVVDTHGKPVKRNELGRIICKLPLPPGTFTTLHKADDRFQETYFQSYPKYYDTMDAGYLDENGYIYVHSREDDVINVAGHRLSTLSIEEAIITHPDVVEAAAIGVLDSLKGEVPLALYVVSDNCKKDEEALRKELIAVVRDQIGPVAAFRLCVSVKSLPKTRSGKIPRKSLANMARGKLVIIPPTIEDPSVYEEILKSLQRIGYAKNAPSPVVS